jgi:hypothetical protein
MKREHTLEKSHYSSKLIITTSTDCAKNKILRKSLCIL